MEHDKYIYCCGCGEKVSARLTNGSEIYPHRKDLYTLPFWKCDQCENFVGCHHKTKQRTRPLGCIPTGEIRLSRKKIHAILDPLWKSGKISRKEVYAKLSDKLGRQYHTAEIRSAEEANAVIQIIQGIYSPPTARG